MGIKSRIKALEEATGGRSTKCFLVEGFLDKPGYFYFDHAKKQGRCFASEEEATEILQKEFGRGVEIRVLRIVWDSPKNNSEGSADERAESDAASGNQTSGV